MERQKNEKNGIYDDIINMPHHVSKKHPQMSILSRAAQFSPFAALSGFEEAIAETSRYTTEKISLNEDDLFAIEQKIKIIQNQGCMNFLVEIVYYMPDSKKSGGSYIRKKCKIKKIDTVFRKIILDDYFDIPFEDISEINIIKKIGKGTDDKE